MNDQRFRFIADYMGKKEEEKVEAKKKAEEEEEEKRQPYYEIVLRVDIDCGGCAKKIERYLRDFEGVEDVDADVNRSMVFVKGKKADPLKVLDRVRSKIHHKQVDLLYPFMKPPRTTEEDEKDRPNKQPVKEEEQRRVLQVPSKTVVVLKFDMHCESCAEEIKKCLLRMEGVEKAEPDFQTSLVRVKGVFDPPKLVEYVYKRIRKHGVIVKQETRNKDANREGNKGGGCGGEKREEKNSGGCGGEKKEERNNGGREAKAERSGGITINAVGSMRNENYYYYYPPSPNYSNVMQNNAYDSDQIFSDENPNACSVM